MWPQEWCKDWKCPLTFQLLIIINTSCHLVGGSTGSYQAMLSYGNNSTHIMISQFYSSFCLKTFLSSNCLTRWRTSCHYVVRLYFPVKPEAQTDCACFLWDRVINLSLGLSVCLSVRGQVSPVSKLAQHSGLVDYRRVGNGKIIVPLYLANKNVLCEAQKTCLFLKRWLLNFQGWNNHWLYCATYNSTLMWTSPTVTGETGLLQELRITLYAGLCFSF